MNKSELISAIAEKAGLTKVNAEEALKATIEAISEELVNGGVITLVGFGTFKTGKREARTGRNPRTGEALEIPAKTVVKFSSGKTLEESVNAKPEPKKKASCKKK
jgi:nucleoid DNA-binding protein